MVLSPLHSRSRSSDDINFAGGSSGDYSCSDRSRVRREFCNAWWGLELRIAVVLVFLLILRISKVERDEKEVTKRGDDSSVRRWRKRRKMNGRSWVRRPR